jgi:hypothetical protein
MRRRRSAGLAHRRECPSDHERREVGGQATRGRRSAPQRAGASQHVPAHRAVGPGGDGNAERRIEDGERQAREESELPVRQFEFEADRLEQRREHAAVHHVHDVREEQNGEDVGAIRRAVRRALRVRLGGRIAH